MHDVRAEILERGSGDRRHGRDHGLEGGANFRTLGRATHPRIGLGRLKGGGLREHFRRSAGEGLGGPDADLRGLAERGVGGVEEDFLKAAPCRLEARVPEGLVGDFQQEHLGGARPRVAAGQFEDARLGAGGGLRFGGNECFLQLAQRFEFGGGFAEQVQIERAGGMQSAAIRIHPHQ